MKILDIVQILLAILLTCVILLQNRDSGLSGLFGGSGNIYQTKRGFEKNLFYATVVIAVLFFLVSLANVIII